MVFMAAAVMLLVLTGRTPPFAKITESILSTAGTVFKSTVPNATGSVLLFDTCPVVAGCSFNTCSWAHETSTIFAALLKPSIVPDATDSAADNCSWPRNSATVLSALLEPIAVTVTFNLATHNIPTSDIYLTLADPPAVPHATLCALAVALVVVLVFTAAFVTVDSVADKIVVGQLVRELNSQPATMLTLRGLDL
jgi:hypothetical protein